MVDFTTQLDDHLKVVEQTRSLIPQMESMARQITECIRGGRTVLWMGNGGSAAEAQHISTELVGRLNRERPGMSSIALTADTAALTAIANDYGFERVFERQIDAICRSGDVVVGLTTSGNSKNVLMGLRLARERGAYVIGMSGASGGQLGDLCDLTIRVPSDNAQRIQEVHLFIGHVVCEQIEADLYGGSGHD